MHALTRLRSRLTYANTMSTIAVFVALGGGAYAVSVPRNSVGTTQLKANAVTAAKVKNRSLLASDFKRGQLILGTAARADDQDPPAAPSGTDVAKMTLTTRSAGQDLRDRLAARPVPELRATPAARPSGAPTSTTSRCRTPALTLAALPGESDGFSFNMLYGVTTENVAPGTHVIRIARTDSPGITSVGQLGAQLSAIQITG